MKNRELKTVAEVFEALGGITKVSKRYCRDSRSPYKAAYAWFQSGTFPPRTYVAMTEDLRKLGFRAPGRLWRMLEEVA